MVQRAGWKALPSEPRMALQAKGRGHVAPATLSIPHLQQRHFILHPGDARKCWILVASGVTTHKATQSHKACDFDSEILNKNDEIILSRWLLAGAGRLHARLQIIRVRGFAPMIFTMVSACGGGGGERMHQVNPNPPPPCRTVSTVTIERPEGDRK